MSSKSVQFDSEGSLSIVSQLRKGLNEYQNRAKGVVNKPKV